MVKVWSKIPPFQKGYINKKASFESKCCAASYSCAEFCCSTKSCRETEVHLLCLLWMHFTSRKEHKLFVTEDCKFDISDGKNSPSLNEAPVALKKITCDFCSLSFVTSMLKFQKKGWTANSWLTKYFSAFSRKHFIRFWCHKVYSYL